MKKLYLFKLNDIDGSVERIEIDKYIEREIHGKIEYVCTIKSVKYWYKHDDLDRLVHNRVVSFNPSYENAKNVILGALQEKSDLLKRSYKRVDGLLARTTKYFAKEGVHNDKDR